MTRILLCGLCPLPFENTPKSFGPGLRTWQFAKGLASEGHEVRLVAQMIHGAYEEAPPRTEERDGVLITRVHMGSRRLPFQLRRLLRQHHPEALVGATVHGSYPLARLSTTLPFWADQFGHFMAEAQAKASRDRNDRVLPYFWRRARTVGRRCDRLSVVSDSQRLAAIGELGALGRLNSLTCGYEFVEVVPCAVSSHQVARPAEDRHPLHQLHGLPEGAFVVLWSGGYNVWSDIDTLFLALEEAMERNPSVHFVSTGGAIAGQDDVSYEKFRERAAASAHARNFHFLGWIPATEARRALLYADLAVVTERPIYEGLLGSKNRVFEWMANGLPAVIPRYADLGALVEQEQASLTYDVGDWRSLASRILWASANADDLVAVASRAREVASRLTIDATTQPLRSWATSPTAAPDR